MIPLWQSGMISTPRVAAPPISTLIHGSLTECLLHSTSITVALHRREAQHAPFAPRLRHGGEVLIVEIAGRDVGFDIGCVCAEAGVDGHVRKLQAPTSKLQ